ncbi:Ubiquitin fusion degradation protein 1-like protein 1 [Botrytis cinerea]
MSYSGFYEGDDPAAMYQMLQQRGMRGPPKRFDEYYRCYPTVMIPGPERDNLNYGGKIIMPPSALEKLTRLHITYPMLFELINSQHPGGPKLTHAGVLEFIADEGKVYLPHWMMQTLGLETGDLFQIKSTDLPPASLIKLQPQSVNFLDISNPKAVLEKAFRDFSTVTKGDIFSFHYNDTIYDIAVLEVKPVTDKMGLVDFAAPLGYVEPTPVRGNGSGTSTPRSAIGGLPAGGMLHSQGTMAQAINYDAIAPTSNSVAQGAKAASSNFVSGGHKLSAKKGTKTPTPTASTPVAGVSTNTPAVSARRTNGPQPLRLPPNKLFFGYEVKPVKTQADKDKENADAKQPHFSGQGQSLKTGKKVEAKSEPAPEPQAKGDSTGRRLDGKDASK